MCAWGLTVGHRTVNMPQTEGLGRAVDHRMCPGDQPKTEFRTKSWI